MNLSRRLMNIYQSQVKALKERLDRIDAEEDARIAELGYERDARTELNDALRGDALPPRRTPEEIAAGGQAVPLEGRESPVARQAPPSTPPVSPLARHYRVLGLEDGADLGAVKAAYARQAARCAAERFPEGSEEQKTAVEIRKRVDAAYDALRDVLDPTAGRFDKLEL